MKRNLVGVSIIVLSLCGCATGQIFPTSFEVRLINKSQAQYCQELASITSEMTTSDRRASKEWHDETLRILLADARKQVRNTGGNAVLIADETKNKYGDVLPNLALIILSRTLVFIETVSLETKAFICPNPLESVTTTVISVGREGNDANSADVQLAESGETTRCIFLRHFDYGDTLDRPLSFAMRSDHDVLEKERAFALDSLRTKTRAVGGDTLVIHLDGKVHPLSSNIYFPVIVADAFRCSSR